MIFSYESSLLSDSLRRADPSPRQSYRLWCPIVCNIETSRSRRSWPALGCCVRGRNIYTHIYSVVNSHKFRFDVCSAEVRDPIHEIKAKVIEPPIIVAIDLEKLHFVFDL
jgi:hypothetical protein